MFINQFFIVAVCLLMTLACEKKGPAQGGNSPSTQNSELRSLNLSDFESLNQRESALNSHAEDYSRAVLKMDFRSFQSLGSESNVVNPTYTRIRTLEDGTYILTWHNTTSTTNANGIDTFYALSPDFKTWTYMGYLWQSYDITNRLGKPDKRLFTNANTLQLSNGELLAIASFRTRSTYGRKDCKMEQGLIVKRSKDGGRTWFGEKEIYHGPCWEAHLIELPSGQIQCFFSESRPWISSSHSGTTMVLSDDGGANWQPALGQTGYRVMRKHWWNQKPQNGSAMYCYTYQMPVGVILNGTSKFAFAMESANQRVIDASGSTRDQFSVAVCFSKDDGKWVHLQGDEVLPKSQRIDSVVTRGVAPYLVQFHSGETLLAYGGTDSRQHFRLGNSTATTFGDDLAALPAKGSWGGLDISRSHTVLSTMRNSDAGYDNAKIDIAKFYLNHSISASNHTVKVDGDNKDWLNTDDALFVGARCQAQAILRCSADKDNYYFLVEVKDETLASSDFAYILLAPDDGSTNVKSNARRIRFNYKGLKSTDQFAGSWRPLDFGVKASVSYDGTPDNPSDKDNGYLAEISVPRESIPSTNGRLMVNLGCFDIAANAEDVIADANNPSKWMIINKL